MAGALFALTCAAWLLWAWLVGAVLLRVLLGLAERLSAGAAWVRSFRSFSDLVTPPLVRKAVDASLAGTLFLRVAGTSLAGGVFLPDVTHAPALVLEPARSPTTAHEQNDATATQIADPELDPGDVIYTVQPGDSLGKLADRFYGDWTAYERIFEANQDRPQPDGRTLQDARKIYQGWQLRLPQPTQTLEAADGEHWYVVQKGDTLRKVSAELLGNEADWPELYELNRGVASLPDGHVLRDPNLIWPGLKLRLPGGVAETAPPPAPSIEEQEPTPSGAATPPLVSPPQPQSPPATPSPAPTPEPTVQAGVPAVPDATETPTVESPLPSSPATANPSPPATQTAAPDQPPQAPIALPDEDPSPPSATPTSQLPTHELAGAAAAGVAVSAAALLLIRRRRVNRRRVLHDDPEPEDIPYDFGGAVRAVAGGFLASDVARLVRQRARGVETDKVPITAARLQAALHAQDLSPLTLLAAFESTRDIAFVAAPHPTRERLLEPEVSEALEERLGCAVEIGRTPDRDLRVELEHLRAVDMARIGQARHADTWVPIGVSEDGHRVHVNLAVCGHVLTVGQDAGVLLGTMALSVAAAVAPSELEIASVRCAEGVPTELEELPHVTRVAHDPATAAAVLGDLLEHVAARRGNGCTGEPGHGVLVVIDELAAVENAAAVVGLLARGAASGIHLLAASAGVAEALPRPLVSAFGARVALKLPDAETSAYYLGRPGAEELDGGGDLYLRIASREPLRLRGFCAEPAEWHACLSVMQREGSRPAAEAAVAERPEPGAAKPGEEYSGAAPDLAAPESNHAVDNQAVVLDAMALAQGVLEEEDRDTFPRDEEADAGPESAGAEPAYEHSADEGTVALEIRCFGPLTVLRNGREIREWKRPAVREVLAYLALHMGRGVSRDQFMEALWPDRDPNAGADLLHSRVYMARKAICDDKERPLIQFSAGQYRLDSERVQVDVAAFENLLIRARRGSEDQQEQLLAEAVELYRGELLADYCPEWAIEAQETYHAKVLDVLNRAAACAARRGDYDLAVERYRRALTLEPINEEIVVSLAKVLHQSGDRIGVVRLRTSLVEALRRELDDPDAEPQPETQDVFDSIVADLDARRAGNGRTGRTNR